MDKELNDLLCLLEGKITAYRMKNPYKEGQKNNSHMELIQIQLEIQKLWSINYKE